MFKTTFYDNRQLLILGLAVIAVAGASASFSLPRLEDPRINNRNVVIVTQLPGASAERVEALVTKKIEEELREVSEVKHIESDSRANVSVITVELEDAVYESEGVFTRLRDKLADVESELPPGASKPEFDDERAPVAYTLILGVTWNDDRKVALNVLNRTAEELADRLRNVPGADVVEIFGEPQEEVTVELDRDRLAQLGLRVADVQKIVASADSKTPAGIVRSVAANTVIEVEGAFESVERIARTPLQTNALGEAVRLGDIATVEKSWRDPTSEIGLVDGERAVYVAARMLDNRRVDLWMEDARAAVDQLRRNLSPSVAVLEVFDQSQYTNQRLGDLGLNLVEGAGVVVLVIFALMGWRSSLLVGFALPLVTAMVLFAMQVLGIPLHQMSIFGLIVALGLLIDNAIVVVDDVGVAMRDGASARRAIAETVGHLFVPLLGSTLTTVVAFLPIFLLPGSLGEFVGPIATTVILALMFSLFASMTIIPALAGIFGNFDGKRSWWRSGLQAPFLAKTTRSVISFAVSHPLVGILIGVMLPGIGLLRLPDLRNQFFPAADRNQFHVQMWMPRDSSIDATSRTALAMEKAMRTLDGVSRVNWLVGGSVPTVYYNMIMDQDDLPSYAQAIVTTDTDERARSIITEVQSTLDSEFPAAQAVVKQLGQGPPVDAPIEVRLFGPSVSTLRRLGRELQATLLQSPQVVHTRTTFDTSEAKLWIEADEVEAQLSGLRLSDVAQQLQATLEGVVGGSVLEQTEELPVRFRLRDSARADIGSVASSRLVLQNGDWAPLSAIGEVSLRPQSPSIRRRDGERNNTVKAYVGPNALAPEVTEAFLERLAAADFELPPGYRMEVGGDAEELATAMGDLLRYAPVLAVVMGAIVVLSFRSFALASILGAVAALSAGLAFLSTWAAGFPLGFNPLIGMAGLIGIALNDSIVVLAQIRTNARARTGDADAIAGEVMKTTRHVLATTLTTIGGFAPLLLSGGDFWPPLATVIAGGVGGATMIALFFVPASYALVRPFVEGAIEAEREVDPNESRNGWKNRINGLQTAAERRSAAPAGVA